jgi:hypothetical protein
VSGGGFFLRPPTPAPGSVLARDVRSSWWLDSKMIFKGTGWEAGENYG